MQAACLQQPMSRSCATTGPGYALQQAAMQASWMNVALGLDILQPLLQKTGRGCGISTAADGICSQRNLPLQSASDTWRSYLIPRPASGCSWHAGAPHGRHHPGLQRHAAPAAEDGAAAVGSGQHGATSAPTPAPRLSLHHIRCNPCSAALSKQLACRCLRRRTSPWA